MSRGGGQGGASLSLKSELSFIGTVNKPRGQPYGGGGSLKDHVLPHEGGRG